jgi:hypothetical protein
MTRSVRWFLWSSIVVGAACGPEPIRPRPLVLPPSTPDARAGGDAEASDAGRPPATTDAGEPAPVDARPSRPKLPAPDGGDAAPVDADTGADAGEETAAASDAGGDAVGPLDAGGGSTTAARAPALGEILIVEVFANPAGTDGGREWIEIASQVDVPLDLSNLHVADAATDVPARGGVLAPGARVVLGQSADPSVNGGTPVDVAYGTRLALNNDAEQISICAGACAGGVVIDHVTWTGAGAAYDGRALVLDRGANLTCPASQPFGAAGDFGTPGEADAGCAAPDAGF